MNFINFVALPKLSHQIHKVCVLDFFCFFVDDFSDLWSVGCVLAELYLLSPMFPGRNSEEQLHLISQIIGPQEKDKKTITVVVQNPDVTQIGHGNQSKGV